MGIIPWQIFPMGIVFVMGLAILYNRNPTDCSYKFDREFFSVRL